MVIYGVNLLPTSWKDRALDETVFPSTKVDAGSIPERGNKFSLIRILEYAGRET